MFAVVGLGNPGRNYEKTRHNVGFRVLSSLSQKLKSDGAKEKFGNLYTRAKFEGEELLLIAPQLYMNRSGEALQPLLHFFKIEIASTIVVYDDLDLLPGALRLRAGGGAGGHNGVSSLLQHLPAPDFIRVRVGIGHPRNFNPDQDVADWVLGIPRSDDAEAITKAEAEAVNAVLSIVSKGLMRAQQQFQIDPAATQKAEKKD